MAGDGGNKTLFRGLLLLIGGVLLGTLGNYAFANRGKLKTFILNLQKQLPDFRDFKISDLFDPIDENVTPLPAEVDLRPKAPPVVNQSSLGSCHDDKTEVLTSEGWKLFKDCKGLKLACVNPETSELMFEYPLDYTEYLYDGDLICYNSANLNFKVTPNHNMLVRKWNEKKRTLNKNYELIEAEKLGWYSGLMNRVIWNGSDKTTESYILKGISDHTLKEQRNDLEISMKSWLRFLGIYMADGTLLKEERKGKCCNKIQIAGSTDIERIFIKETLTNLGVNYCEIKDRYTFSNKRIYKSMEDLGLKGVKAPYKFVPQFVFEQSADLIKEFLLGYFMGDGCMSLCFDSENQHKSFYTSSYRLANDIQQLIFMSGNESKIAIRPPRSSVMKDGRIVNGVFPEHRISICERKNLSISKKEYIHKEYYNGYVYCAEMPTYHTLVTRRENTILISGNCTGCAGVAARAMISDVKTAFSRLFQYYKERELEGTVNSDAGATMRSIGRAMKMYGVCEETYMPYNINNFANSPSSQADSNAENYKIAGYYSLGTLQEIRQTLLQGQKPILALIELYDNFSDTGSDGMVDMPKGDFVGNHAVLICGYSDAGKYLIVRNSWGTGFGNKGYCYIPYDYVEKGNATDFWYLAP